MTHTPEECAAKIRSINGPTCTWAPPDVADLDPTTVACFYTSESKLINFEKAEGLQDLRSFINSSLLNPDSAFYANNYLKVLAGSLKSDMYMLEDFPLKYNGASFGTATLGIGEFTIIGLDTLDRLQLLDASPYEEGGDGLRFTNGDEYEPWVTPTDDGMDGGNSTMRRRLAANQEDYGYQDNKYTSRT
jgi:hypothetical protein